MEDKRKRKKRKNRTSKQTNKQTNREKHSRKNDLGGRKIVVWAEETHDRHYVFISFIVSFQARVLRRIQVCKEGKSARRAGKAARFFLGLGKSV